MGKARVSRRRLCWWTPFVLAASAIGLPAGASAAPGTLEFKNCLTTELESGPVPDGGSGACGVIGTPNSNGADTGLDNPESIAISPDGKSAYAVAGNDDAVMRFNRNTTTGALSFAFCFTGETAGFSCEQLPEAAVNGADSGMDDPEAVVVAPDGRSVYVTSRSDAAIAMFKRQPNGFITYKGCVSGDSATGPLNSGACTQLPAALPSGINSGLADPKQKELAISSDGESVYAVSDTDDAVVRFTRDPATSILTFEDCITGEDASGPGPVGTDACSEIPTSRTGGEDSGLDAPRWAELGRGGRSLYVAADRDDAIARFDRNLNTGELTYRDCITGEESTGPGGTGSCRALPVTAPFGVDSGLDRPLGIVVKGEDLYAVAGNDAALARFSMNGQGRLSFESCLSGETETGPAGTDACRLSPTATAGALASGMNGFRDLELKGRNLYASAQGDSSLVTFMRNAATGSVKFARCLTGDALAGPTESEACRIAGGAGSLGGVSSGLQKLETIAVSPDGRNVYGAAEQDDAISRFKHSR